MARKPPIIPGKPRRDRGGLRVIDGGKGSSLITQPSPRSYLHWTPRALQTLQVTADAGDLTRLGDLGDQMIADDRINKLLDDVSGGVLGCDLTFETNAHTTVGDAEKGEELEEDWPQAYGEDELASFQDWLLIVGVAFARHEKWVVSQGDGHRVVPVFKTWHPKHFRYDWEHNTWLFRDGEGRESPITAGDGEWIIGTLKGDYRPWANGKWRGCSPWWMLKRYGISDWGVHSEKASKLVLSSNEFALADDRKKIAAEIFQLAKDAVISLPPGFDLKIVELSANTKEIYEAQIEAANMGFTLAIVGQNLTSEVSGGSLAAANTHERKELRVFRYVAKKLGRILQEQSLPWWAEYNFGDRKLAPYPRWATDPPEDKGAKVAMLGALGTGLVALQTVGFKLSAKAIEEQYGIKLEEMSDAEVEALKPPEPALPAGGGGAAGGGKKPEGARKPLPGAKGPKPREAGAKRARMLDEYETIMVDGEPVYVKRSATDPELYNHNHGADGKFAGSGGAGLGGAAAKRGRAARERAGTAPKSRAERKPRAKVRAGGGGVAGPAPAATKPVTKTKPPKKSAKPKATEEELVQAGLAAYRAKVAARTAKLTPSQKATAKAERTRVKTAVAAAAKKPEPKPLAAKPEDKALKVRSDKPNGAIKPLARVDIDAHAPHAGTALAAKLNPASDRHSAAFKALSKDAQRELFTEAYAWEPSVRAMQRTGATDVQTDRAQRFVSDYLTGPSGQAQHAHRLKQTADTAYADFQVKGSWAQKHYASTQALIEHQLPQLRAAGRVDADGFVTLFRGVGGAQAQGIHANHAHGDSVKLNVNKLSSWSDDPSMARKFGTVVKSKIHYSRAFFAHPASSRAHSDEGEWIMVNDEGVAHAVVGATADVPHG